MEILSTGEKIKRQRILKGYTLKQLCGDKISISKMSCIENNKIKPEKNVVGYICEKLEFDPEYLEETVEEQLAKRLTYLKSNKKYDGYLDELESCVEYCEQYNLNSLAIEFMHLLFNGYLDNGRNDVVQVLSMKYYDIYGKTFSDENKQMYYIDVARFFYVNGEYEQAINYYEEINKDLYNKKNKNYKEYLRIVVSLYNLSACYLMLKQHEKAYEEASKLINLMEFVDEEWKKAEIYHMLAVLSLRLDKGDFNYLENKSYEFYKDDLKLKAQAMYNYGVVMFEVGLKDKAVDYVKRSIEYMTKEDKYELVRYMLLSVEELLDNNYIDDACEICEEALNNAINMNNNKFIERAYYYKANLLLRKNEYDMAEMYMNLSLDFLLKYGNKEEVKQRYLEMGNMYYNSNNVYEALKYFDLSMQMNEKL